MLQLFRRRLEPLLNAAAKDPPQRWSGGTNDGLYILDHLGYPRKLRTNGDRINGWFHLLINGVHWGYHPLILTWDIQVSHHPVTPLKFKRMVHLKIIQGRKGKSSTRNLHYLGFQPFIIHDVTVTSRIRHKISSRKSRPKPYHCYWVGGGKIKISGHTLKKSRSWTVVGPLHESHQLEQYRAVGPISLHLFRGRKSKPGKPIDFQAIFCWGWYIPPFITRPWRAHLVE